MTHTPKSRFTWLLSFVLAILISGHASGLQSSTAEAPQAAASATPTPSATPSPKPAAKPAVGRIIVGESVHHDVSPPLRDLAKRPMPQPSQQWRYVAIVKLEQPQLRYLLLQHFSRIQYCDSYCIVTCVSDIPDGPRGFAELKEKDPATLAAILEHAHWNGKTEFTDAEKAEVYRQYRRLRRAVRLQPAEAGYKFELADIEPLPGPRTNGVPNRTQGYRIEGLIIPPDKITVLKKTPAWVGCPICLARGTKIDTPNGPVAIEDLRLGMLVWTLDRKNERVAAPVLQVSAVPVPVGHRVVHLVMEDGRELWVSAGHPTADGRSVGELEAGNSYSASVVLKSESVSYAGEKTYDLLPAGDTGFYWANGILVGSTLKKSK
jgi:hypothetical protein